MSGAAHIPTAAIQRAVRGREAEVLDALEIPWRNGAPHICCPYPNHDDRNASWRFDPRKRRAYCTCVERGSDSVFGIIMKVRGVNFEGAKLLVAEALGCHDLMRSRDGERHQATDVASLLRPPADQRDDNLVRAYLAHRLGVAPDDVLMPTTPVAGWRALAYYDPPARGSTRPRLIGHHPCAAFGTRSADGHRHAHRIYLAPGGAGKAELGTGPGGKPRDPKKSAKVAEGDNTVGRAVVWGRPKAALHIILTEGVENAAVIALASRPEIEAGTLAVAAAITAGGVEAFQPYPETQRVTVAADRDEAPEKRDTVGYRRGERAARAFGMRHGERLEVNIALPGAPGEKVDWLDVLRRDGAEVVRAGIGAAKPFTQARDEAEEESLAARRRLLCSLVERSREDPGAAFEPEALLLLTATRAESPAEFERVRTRLKAAGVRVGELDRELEPVRSANGAAAPEPGAGRPLALPEPEPWPEPVAGAALLDAIGAAFRRYLALPPHAAGALALWVVHAHAFDAAQVSPRLALTSPEKRCGKSTTLIILGRLAPRPLRVANVTAAALFRTVEAARPTLLIDEADTFLAGSDELRGILNSGHSRATAQVIRLVGDDHEPRAFATWAPVALAAIGRLPGTLEDRAVAIRLRRRRPDEVVDRLRLDRFDHLDELARQAVRWAADHLTELAAADPDVPAELHDRAADNWRPLLAIADRAGGEWPKKARAAAQALSGDSEEAEDSSARVQLLTDLRGLFGERSVGALPSADICEALAKREDRPWPEWKAGKAITQRQLAKLLEPFGIRPGTKREGGRTFKGYEREQFKDVFARYLPPDRSVTASQPSKSAASSDPRSVTSGRRVTAENQPSPNGSADCDVVTDRKEGIAAEEGGGAPLEEPPAGFERHWL